MQNRIKNLLIEYIHNPKKIFEFLICEIIVFVLFFSSCGMTLQFQVSSNQEEKGNLIVYYQKSDIYEFDENSLDVQEVTLNQESTKVKFHLDTKHLRDIRLDFDGIGEFTIHNIDVYLGQMKMSSYSADILAKCVVLNNDATYETENGELILKSVGGDSYIILGIANAGVFIKFVAICSVILFAVGCILFILIQYLISLKQKKLDKLKKYTRFFFLFFLSGLIVYADYETVSQVLQRKQETYMVQTTESGALAVQDDTIHLEFIDHGKELSQFCIQVSDNNVYEGTVSYKVKKENTVVKEVKKVDIGGLVDGNDLILDVSDVHMERGTTYTVDISFDLVKQIYLTTNADGSVRTKQVYQFVYRPLLIGIIVLLNIIVVAFGIWIYKKGFRNYIMASFAIILGIVVAFIITPCSMDDEYRHFLRAYEIASGNVCAESLDTMPADTTGVPPLLSNGKYAIANVPVEVSNIKYLDQCANFKEATYYAEVSSHLSVNELFYQLTADESGENVNVSLAATVGLSPLSYLPQIVLILFGKIFGMKALTLFYLARIGNVIGCVLLIWIAAKILPEYQNIIWTMAFIPRITTLRSSCSTDGLLYSLIILLIVYLLSIRIKKVKWMVPKRLLIICGLAGYIASMKLPYVLVAGLVLLFRKENYFYLKKKWQVFICNIVIAGAIGIVSLGIFLGLANFTSQNLRLDEVAVEDVIADEAETEELNENETMAEVQKSQMEPHLAYVMQNPKAWLVMILHEYMSVYERLKVSINGYFCVGSYYLLLLICLFAAKRRLSYLDRIYMILIGAGIWFGILMVFYRMVDPAVSSIPNIGDRYILPIVPLIAFAMPQGNEKTEKVLNYVIPFALVGLWGANAVRIITLFS